MLVSESVPYNNHSRAARDESLELLMVRSYDVTGRSCLNRDLLWLIRTRNHNAKLGAVIALAYPIH